MLKQSVYMKTDVVCLSSLCE